MYHIPLKLIELYSILIKLWILSMRRRTGSAQMLNNFKIPVATISENEWKVQILILCLLAIFLAGREKSCNAMMIYIYYSALYQSVYLLFYIYFPKSHFWYLLNICYKIFCWLNRLELETRSRVSQNLIIVRIQPTYFMKNFHNFCQWNIEALSGVAESPFVNTSQEHLRKGQKLRCIRKLFVKFLSNFRVRRTNLDFDSFR